jgi:hypothetical protein
VRRSKTPRQLRGTSSTSVLVLFMASCAGSLVLVVPVQVQVLVPQVVVLLHISRLVLVQY